MVQLSNNEVLNSKATSTSRSNMLQPTDDAPPEWPAAKVVYGSATNGTWIEARAYFALTLDEADQLQLMIRHTLRNRGLAGALLGQMKTETKQVVQAVTVQAEYILDGSGHRRWGRAKPPDWDCGGPQQMLSKIVHKDGNTYRKSLIKQQKQQNQESCYGNDATIDRGNSAFVPQESPNFGSITRGDPAPIPDENAYASMPEHLDSNFIDGRTVPSEQLETRSNSIKRERSESVEVLSEQSRPSRSRPTSPFYHSVLGTSSKKFRSFGSASQESSSIHRLFFLIRHDDEMSPKSYTVRKIVSNFRKRGSSVWTVEDLDWQKLLTIAQSEHGMKLPEDSIYCQTPEDQLRIVKDQDDFESAVVEQLDTRSDSYLRFHIGRSVDVNALMIKMLPAMAKSVEERMSEQVDLQEDADGVIATIASRKSLEVATRD